METPKVKGLAGLIFSSSNPFKLAEFYRTVIGLPLELHSHGGLREHWECDFDNVHFAILPKQQDGKMEEPSDPKIVPSFVVADIAKFTKAHNLQIKQPVLDLGEGSYVAGIHDTDGNLIRLWMHRNNA